MPTAPPPDLLAELPGWHTHDHRASVGSTNDVALAALGDGVPPGLVVTADVQTAGRGRRGRVWVDHPDGANLASSATLAAVPDRATLVPLAAGLAVATALGAVGVAARLKWPNDVVVPTEEGHAKLCGILVESAAAGLVVGVGWNIDHRGLQPVPGATSAAAQAGADVDRWGLLATYLRALAHRVAQVTAAPTGLLDDYRVACETLGRRVTATVPGGRVTGVARDVDHDGALVVATTDGPVRVASGEVVHVR